MKLKKLKLKNKIKFIFHTLGFFYKIAFRMNPTYFIYVCLLIITNTIFPLMNIVLPKYLIEELINDRNITKLVVLVAIIVVGNSVFEILRKICVENQNRIADKYERHFDMMISYRAMEMDFECTEDPNILDQCKKADTGLRNSRGIQGVTENFVAIVSSILVLLGVIGLVITSSPWLIFILFINILISTYLNRKMNQVEQKYFEKNIDTNRAFDYVCNDLPNFRLGKDIRLYEAESMMLYKEDKLGDVLIKKEKNHAAELLKFSQKNVWTNAIRETLTFLYLGYQAIKGFITIGDFIMLLQASVTFSNSLTGIITNGMEINLKLTFMNEYIVFMNIKNPMKQGNKEIQKTEDYKIEFRNVSFHYPNTNNDILKNISITIHPKEHLSIVGLNGAGKTTFIKLLCRLYDVSEGEILLNNVNINEYACDEYRKMLSVVFQDYKLLSFSIKENIILKNTSKEEKEIEQELEQELIRLCDIGGLGEKIDSLDKGIDTNVYKEFDKEGIEPSGGEAQKLAIIRALYKNAPIVILDEPTAALDPVAEYEIYNHFDKLVGGKTAVYISHRLSSCKFCDKIAVFSEGTIKEYGNHDDLIKIANGIYQNMFQAQAQYYQ